jgi:plasmid stabilization system protein ParE
MARRSALMAKLASIDIAPSAFQDLERLEDFLVDADDPMAGFLLPFILEALAILALQPGIGRPVDGQKRELIIHRGRSGYLARYDYQRHIGHVTVLRIRHQREAGYTLEEI